MNKQKIQIIFLWWFACLLVIVSAQILTAPTKKNYSLALANENPEVLGAFTSKARGEEIEQPVERPVKIGTIPVGNLSAAGVLVYDEGSGVVLFAKNENVRYPIASLTKLMTALVAYNNGLDKNATITPEDLVSVSPSLSLKVGERVSFQDLFNAMLIGSENDAAKTLANHVLLGGESEFITVMNKTAQALDMQDTQYSNPLGFDSAENYSTAKDLQKLVTETQKLTAFTSLGRRLSYNFFGSLGSSYSAKTTNKLLATHPEIEAVKSGTTPSSKQSLVSKISIGPHKIVVIVLGSLARERDTLTLESYVADNFIWQ